MADAPLRLIERAQDLPDDLLDACDARPADTRVLMTSPEHFTVRYVINPHMADAEGRPHRVDDLLAREQWRALRAAYESLGYEVEILPGDPELPDMVFAANPSLPFVARDGKKKVVVSRMRHPERRAETAHFEAFWEAHGYEPIHLPVADDRQALEGGGDVLFWPEKRLALVGIGPRTSRSLAGRLPEILACPVVALTLVDPDFYHLDTALALLDAATAMHVVEAFDDEGRAILERLVPRLLEAPPRESRRDLACNAHAPDGRHVLIDSACLATMAMLRDAGFTPLPIDTSEFRKAGGSVYCLKCMFP